jgi:DNA helicase-2/ATP-dependent DNA helicase PcrA
MNIVSVIKQNNLDSIQKILTPAFLAGLKKLNPRQREAVETLDGPVLVLAGPGTGKTEVLSLRVGQILSETDMQASNILCLTYSRAGVASMKKRLGELIGAESENVSVETFHSFADKILKSERSNREPSRYLLTTSHRYLILEKLLSRPETGGVYCDGRIPSGVRLKSLSRIFGLLKKEGISGEKLRTLSDHCIENLLMNDQNYRAIRVPLNESGKRLRDQLVRFRDTIAPLFEAYQSLLYKYGYFDYEDLLEEAVSLLKKDSGLLLRHQERYQYILADEFQDTNDKQLEMLLLIAEPENPNLFIVGDDDQCIYRFQGASRRNFEAIRPLFRNLRTIVLDTNYRSTSEILKRVFCLIDGNPGRDELKSAPLISGIEAGWKLSPTIPVLRVYNDEEQEDYDIANRLKLLMEDASFTGTAAVLYRKHSDSKAIIKWLDLWQIPYEIRSQCKDLLATDGGKKLLWLSRVATLVEQNADLAETYFSNYALSYLGRDKFAKIHLRWKAESEKISLFSWLHRQSDADSFKLTRVIRFCNALSDQMEHEMSAEILDEFLNQSGIESPDEKKGWMDFLDGFMGSDRKRTLSSFYSLLHYHEVMLLAIEYTPSGESSARIILSTIWGSKGLEYDAVFVKGCLRRNWEAHEPPRQQIRVPHFLNRFVPDESDALEDLRRLIYVAATRAKCSLTFSYANMSENGKVQTHTELLNGLIGSGDLLLEELSSVVVPKPPRSFIPLSSDVELRFLVRDRINRFSISPSSLYNWVDSVEEFFIRNICKVPGLPQLSLSLGSFMHKILEELVRAGGGSADAARLRRVATEVFSRFAMEFHESHRSMAFEQAIRGVMNYWEANPLPRATTELEKGLSADLGGGVKLYGILDRVEETDDSVIIIDYKSGLYKQSFDPFISDDEPGSGYWRQAAIYKLLAEENYSGRSSHEVHFHFIELGKKEMYCEEVNEGFIDWLRSLSGQMKTLYGA